MDNYTLKRLAKIESKLLNALENIEEYTTSDLQGIIEASMREAYNIGYNQSLDLPF